jgi:hypothetical protein
LLEERLGFESAVQIRRFAELAADIRAFCEGVEDFEGDPFQHIFDQIKAFCRTYERQGDVQRCTDLFQEMVEGLR